MNSTEKLTSLRSMPTNQTLYGIGGTESSMMALAPRF